MALVRFERHESLGEIVIDSPPLNLFSAPVIADLRDAAYTAGRSDVCDLASHRRNRG